MTADSAARHTAVAAAILIFIVAVLAIASLDPGAMWNRAVAYVLTMQRDLHRGLAAAMRSVQANEAAAAWSLAGLGFLYGVFHAAGPGHGKVVILDLPRDPREQASTRRGAVRAVVIAPGGDGARRGGPDRGGPRSLFSGGAEHGRRARERELRPGGSSRPLPSVRSGRRLLARHRASNGDRPAASARDPGACGHGHGPGAADLSAPPSLRHFVATVLSVGLRPCSGAILVLVLAYAMDLVWAGATAVMAMSAGTALTVSALAALSVYARKTALALGGYLSDDSPRFAQVLDGIGMLGGILTVLLGVALLQASLVAARHPLL